MTSQPQGEKPEEKFCPGCNGSGRTFNNQLSCPTCGGEGKLWCAMCGTWGNHRSGGCPELQPAPATPGADEESATPLCNALGGDEWTVPDNRLVVSIRWKDLARQLERDIIKTARCFAEATSQLASLQSARDDLRSQLQAATAERVALEAQVEKLTTALKLWFYQGSSELVSAALSSQPDLPLIEEVREFIQMTNDAIPSDFARRLLARLNPAK